MKSLTLRIENLEFRTKDKKTTGEIVQYGEKNCWTIAYWEKGSDGFNLKFVGNAPFDNSVNIEDFFHISKYGQNFLEQSLEEKTS